MFRRLLLAVVSASFLVVARTDVAAAVPVVVAERLCVAIPARIAYVSPRGLVVCDGGRGSVILPRRDVGGLAWSADGTLLRLQIGRFDGSAEPASAEYDVRHHVLHTIAYGSANVRCDGFTVRCATRRLRAERIDLFQTMPARDMLAPVALHLRVDGAPAATYTTPRGGDLAIARVLPDESGLLFWNEPYRSASAFSDGLPLWDFTSRYGARSYGIQAFPNRDWLAISPTGRTLLTIAGRDREVFQAPHRLTRCDLGTARCVAWHARVGHVELDPAWAPDERSVAFVRAPVATAAQLSDGYPGRTWDATRRLVVVDMRTGIEREIAGIGAVFEPRWLTATRLLVIAQNRLLDIDTTRGRRVAVGPVAADPQLYYGEEDWHGGRLAVFVPAAPRVGVIARPGYPERATGALFPK